MAFSYWPGACDITYTHSAEPLTLPTKSGPSRALPSLIADAVPPCNLNPFLPNGHLQTFWTAMKFDGPPIHYKRRTFAASQDSFAGHFTVDFVTAAPPPASDERDEEGNLAQDVGLTEDPVGVGHHYLPPRTTYFSNADFAAFEAGSDDDKPLLICLHGLSGGSYETYLRHVLAPLVAPTAAGAKAGGLSGGEWEALVVNSRGCAGSKITNSMLYNARATWDVRQTVKWAREKWPRRKMFGVGFSLGANILTTVGTSPLMLCSKEAKAKLQTANPVPNSTFSHIPEIDVDSCLIFLVSLVPRRRRLRLPPLRGPHHLQPLETRSRLLIPPALLARHESLQQSHGQIHARTL